ncbi:MAG TPA: hypothetical protein VFD38_15950 [Myxococcaceae bacterium]|nr:hypothetical protein [Myxococcaceae bacterium]
MLGRLLSLVLGLAVVAFVAYWALNHVAGAERADPEGRSQPKAVLDRTRETGRRIEQDAERRVHETERKMEER